MSGTLHRLAQRWHFVRHVPISQLLARLRLTIRRRIETRFPPRRTIAGRHRFSRPLPQPIFAPRPASGWRDGDGWRFRFVGRDMAMPDVIDWRLPADDAATQLWRMNLHYMEWLEGLDADDGLDAITDWIAANPPCTRESWSDSWNSYALSLRIVCWLQFLARHGIDGRPDIATSLAEQLDFLVRHLEDDVRGNHLMKNVKALILGGVAIEGQSSGQWLALGRKLLDREVRRQILPDGMHYELSPSYHAQVFADVLECHHALGSAGLPSGLAPTLEKMAAATAMLSHPDGGPAQFNDSGLTMAYTPAECLTVHERLTGASVPEIRALPDAGYHRLQCGELRLIADAGKIGPDALPAHAHGDIGSFELSAGQHRMIVDQGVFEYVDGPKRRQSRATASHNIVALDSGDQADFFGAFRCGKRPRWVACERTERRLTVRFPAAWNQSAMIERDFAAETHGLTIRDRIIGAFRGTASASLLFHPDCRIVLSVEGVRVSRGGITLSITSNIPHTIEPAVWWPDMGVELPTQRLRLTFPPDCRESALAIQIVPTDGE